MNHKENQWEYCQYEPLQLIPGQGYLGCFFDRETNSLRCQEIDFLVVAKKTTVWMECDSRDENGMPINPREMDREEGNAIASVRLMDTGFMVNEEFSNFGGIIKKGDDMMLGTYLFSTEIYERIKNHGMESVT
jgi:hypothetical protein